MTRLLLLLVALGASSLAAPLPLPRPKTADDLKVLQGTWLAVRGFNSRRERAWTDIDLQVRFTSDLMTFSCAGEEITTWVVTLDTKKSPREMSRRCVGGVSKGSVGQSMTTIYRVDGDSLTIAHVEGRGDKLPTDFEGKKSGEWVNTYKRKR